MSPEAADLLAYLVQHGGGSIGGYSAAAVTWLHGQRYIETWRAGYWTATDRGASALLSARRAQEGSLP